MKLLLALLALTLLVPTSERFVVSSASCQEVYLEWDERSPDITGGVYVKLVTWDDQMVLATEYFPESPLTEWWWAPLNESGIAGREWSVSGYAYTDVGRIDTFNHLIINCAGGKVYLPVVEGG